MTNAPIDMDTESKIELWAKTALIQRKERAVVEAIERDKKAQADELAKLESHAETLAHTERVRQATAALKAELEKRLKARRESRQAEAIAAHLAKKGVKIRKAEPMIERKAGHCQACEGVELAGGCPSCRPKVRAPEPALPGDPVPLNMEGRYRVFSEVFVARAKQIAPHAEPIIDRVTVDSDYTMFCELSQAGRSVHTVVSGALHQPAVSGSDAAAFLAIRLRDELGNRDLHSPPATTGSGVVLRRYAMPAEAGGSRPRFGDRSGGT